MSIATSEASTANPKGNVISGGFKIERDAKGDFKSRNAVYSKSVQKNLWFLCKRFVKQPATCAKWSINFLKYPAMIKTTLAASCLWVSSLSWTWEWHQLLTLADRGATFPRPTTIRKSHTECCKGDDESLWKRGKFDPPPPKNPLIDGHQNMCR